MSHFFSNSSEESVALQSIDGLLLERHTVCTRLPAVPTVVVVREVPVGRVALVTGGGSGHEPMHAGFIEPGFLSAAVCGRVFASPPVSHVRAAIEDLLRRGVSGVLVLVKNYTGDIINFGAAVEQCRAQFGAARVEMSVIGDDAAFGPPGGASRGLAGTVLWYRMISAAAADGLSLSSVKAFADEAGRCLRSMGASLQSCVLPSNAAPASPVPSGMVELGLGIHGEPGSKVVPYNGIDDVVDTLLKHTLGEEVAAPPVLCVFVNNLGGTSNLEMGAIVRATWRGLLQRNPVPEVCCFGSGAICTALNMHGFSLTVVNCTQLAAVLATSADSALHAYASTAGLAALLMRPSATPLRLSRGVPAALAQAISTPPPKPAAEEAMPILSDRASALHKQMLLVVARLSDGAARYNALDAACGDGDTGDGIAALGKRLASAPSLPRLAEAMTGKSEAWAAAIAALAVDVCDEMGGSLGAVASAFVAGFGAAIPSDVPDIHIALTSRPALFVAALRGGMGASERVGAASRGDRTFLDALYPVLDVTLPDSWTETMISTVTSAANATAAMRAKRGRARYLDGREVGHADPGAIIASDLLSYMFS